ncbi:hypothetical protein [Modestobacter italicus]|uniref:hypothetical protein n=1 Tax=Modestobacter italicus (strain DSM 44449 / CECT 9708 / BC 501) TaxID=2732864 RepID=UPI001FE6C0D3|nr:hypothetical protein [Modestobacter italicus]
MPVPGSAWRTTRWSRWWSTTARRSGWRGGSLWPRRPDLVLTFELRPVAAETALRWTLTAVGEPPDQSLTGHLRHRVNHLLWADLRMSYGQ